ncbi:MAG: ISL3 family transposase [Atopobiaceae bacterium]|nr:ISL3 family transposase [Atopobiaceae bacterium]
MLRPERFRCSNPQTRGYQTQRWRAMDLARSVCYLEYRPARVSCPEHGVRVERVPWARHGSRFTRDFEDWVACLAVRCCMSAVARVARVEWHSVGGICKRVYDEIESQRGVARFDGLRRIGIDETSYKRGHRYLTVVVDHDRGRLVWAHEGYGKDVLSLFLDELTREQRRGIEVVTADGARWIRALVRRRCPNARWVMDPFHVVEWMNDALDEVRRREWQAAKAEAASVVPRTGRRGRPRKNEVPPEVAEELRARATSIKNSRYALVKNPEDLTDSQRAKLAELRRAGGRLFAAWDLKEDLRAVFRAETPAEADALLSAWLRRAAYCKIKPVVEVEKKVRRRRADVIAAVELGIGNGRVESINQKIKVTIAAGYGFRNTDNLIAIVMLRCSDEHPALPWEDRGEEKRRRDERKRRDRERDRKRRREKAAKARVA